ncbi:MAG: proton-conducting transporter membrane subunit [Spirochaetaceae bacterium]|jgi:hydrogenase-4 component B|nr:proton-conducting transporter membrane subunit [Spirochaetaceae bacterium]
MIFFLIIISISIIALSGIPGIFLSHSSGWGQRISVFLICLGSLSGLIGVGLTFFYPDNALYFFPWQAEQNPLLGIDTLSAFFLVPIFLIGSLGSIFGLGYWSQKNNKPKAAMIHIFSGILMAGMALLVISKHALSFLFGWEAMALAAFFLMSAEDEQEECRKSSLIYLMATHLGTLVLFGMFLLWRSATGSFDFIPMQGGTASVLTINILFFLSFIGFGLKAGIMPLHFWLPGAHANAPSHISALLSGVMLKMGIYGIIRMLSLFPAPPPLWGGIILIAGAVSGLLGVIFALAQHDLKRLLAYHSVENIGIILLGLGLAMLGRSYHHPMWIILGMAGCLLHVWNHSLFKSLLFLGSGSVLFRTHTRQIDKLGGLAKHMPWTAGLFLIGAVAISGLPPLNGFISEFFIYLGLFQTLTIPENSVSIAIIAAPVLAMIGALAVACFVKIYGSVFLGFPRSDIPENTKEVPLSMILPMMILAVLCLFLGLAPAIVVPILDKVIAPWLPAASALNNTVSLASLVPFSSLQFISISLISIFSIMALWMFIFKKKNTKTAGTWDCGYADPGPRMQYTASSFAQSLILLFSRILKPKTHDPEIRTTFPTESFMNSHVDEITLDRTLIPGFLFFRKTLKWFYRFQQGRTQNYLFYILVAVVIMLSTLIPVEQIISSLLSK